jgi:hypothetical protein
VEDVRQFQRGDFERRFMQATGVRFAAHARALPKGIVPGA